MHYMKKFTLSVLTLLWATFSFSQTVATFENLTLAAGFGTARTYRAVLPAATPILLTITIPLMHPGAALLTQTAPIAPHRAGPASTML
jgi:hypothetical protein